MPTRSSWSLLLFLLTGCAAVPRPDRASEPDAAAVSAVVEGLHSPDPARRALARSLLEEIGPAGASVLRGMLTRRLEPADPLIDELIDSLDVRESLLAEAARDQILLRGRRVAPDLWERLLATESPALAFRALELLARLDGPARVRSAVEALLAWGWAPKWLEQSPAFPPAAARISPVREADGEPTFARRVWQPTDHPTMRQFLAEIDEASVIPEGTIMIPVERSEK